MTDPDPVYFFDGLSSRPSSQSVKTIGHKKPFQVFWDSRVNLHRQWRSMSCSIVCYFSSTLCGEILSRNYVLNSTRIRNQLEHSDSGPGSKI